MKITILGLGRMGRPIARNLMEDGHTVTLFRRRPDQPVPGELAGARSAYNLAEAVGGAQVVVSVVTDGAAEEELTFGPGGLLAHLGPGAIHLCMSSVSPATSLRLAQAHQDAGQGYVAAPILGSPRAAANRQLWFLAGGADVHVVRCLGMLEALGRGVTRVGTRVDLAHGLKLGAQGFSLAVIGALAEALAYGEKIGYSPSSFLRLLNLGQFKSPQVDAWGALMVRHDHEPSDQTLDQAVQGLDLLQASARDLGLTLPLAGHLRRQLARAREEGLGDLDVTALSMIHRREAGLPGPWDSSAPARPRPEAAPGPAAPAPAPSAPSAPRPAPAVASAPPPPTPPTAAPAPPPPTPPTAGPAPEVGQVPATHPAPPAPATASRTEAPRPAPAPHPGGRAGRGRGSHGGRGGGSNGRSQDRSPAQPAPAPTAPTPAAPVLQPRPDASEARPDRLPTWNPPPAWTWTRQVPIQGPSLPMAAAPAPVPRPEPARVEAPAPAAPATPPPAPDLPAQATRSFEPDPNLYYEEERGAVWGYHGGELHPTPWRRLEDAEFGVTEVTLVRIGRHRSLNPLAVRDFAPLFGGRSRILLSDGQALVLGREPTRKLKFILGI